MALVQKGFTHSVNNVKQLITTSTNSKYCDRSLFSPKYPWQPLVQLWSLAVMPCRHNLPLWFENVTRTSIHIVVRRQIDANSILGGLTVISSLFRKKQKTARLNTFGEKSVTPVAATLESGQAAQRLMLQRLFTLLTFDSSSKNQKSLLK